MRYIQILGFVLLMGSMSAQVNDRKIEFPDLDDYLTLKCDLHIHTVFSDGSVWPDIRIEEALRDGLDAISLTEHLEYQPHQEDIPHSDRNRSFEIAKEQAKAHDLLVIHGAEITRNLPPGHANAIFIQDANALNVEDALEAYREAKKQGAYVFWNHPNWVAQQRDGIATLTDFHRNLISEGLLHGIEVVNDLTYSDEALQIAQENDLTVMGTSDIHGLVDWQFNLANGGHRPISLVFAREKTEASMKEALLAGRSVAWFDNLLVGHEGMLKELVKHSISVVAADYQGPSSVITVELKNISDATYYLDNVGAFTYHNSGDIVVLPPHESVKVEVKTLQQLSTFQLDFEVLNALIAPNVHPKLSWSVDVDL